LHSTKEYEDTIDLEKLNDSERLTVLKIQRSYESAMKNLSDKAFRRFSRTRMQNLQEENK
jgi:hypothetical protein